MKQMKHTYIIVVAAALLGTATSSRAQQLVRITGGDSTAVVDGVKVNLYETERSGKFLSLDLEMDIRALSVKRNQGVVVTPRLVGEEDSLQLPAVGVYGRRRYFQSMRKNMLTFADKRDESYRVGRQPDTKDYHEILRYGDWMNGATLWIYRDLYGCNGSLLDEQAGSLGGRLFSPTLIYAQPRADKARTIEGRAYVDFVVDKTNIDPNYRMNAAELAKIHASIDSVRGDREITITNIWLKGFASPESPYAHNTDLAKGRVEAVKQHVLTLYAFPDSLITTDYEPEDWEGLRRFVGQSGLEHRDDILEIIDYDMDPDKKEALIKRTYPEEYRFLLTYCYPALRHTDYRISYEIRTFTDLDEIRMKLRTEPNKLDLNEIYALAQTLEPGSDLFNEAFETAVELYPTAEAANLNAANACMKRGDIYNARRFLVKAGGTPEAVYARGALAMLDNDYATARECMRRAKDSGIELAQETLDYLDGIGQ